MYDIILMDLDNTILDFNAAERSSFIKIIEKSGLVYSDDLLEKYKQINNTLWRNLEQGKISKEVVLNTRFHEFFQLYGIAVNGKVYEEEYRFHLNNSSGLIPHAQYTLKELKKRGKKVYSASNGVYTTQIKRLKNADIINLFDGHFISDRIKYEKPSPCFFEFCIKNIEMAPNSSLLMVGDSPTSDIMGAVNAGIDSCFYHHNKDITCTNATYTINDIAELLDIV